MGLFKIDELTTPVEPISKFMQVSEDTSDFVICKKPDKLKKLINALVPGKQVHFVCNGYWSAHDLIVELLKIYKPAELYLTTYAIREYAVRMLILAQERGDLISLKMLLDVRTKARTPEVFHLAMMKATQIYLTSLHAKVTVIRSAVGSVSIVSSQNLTSNPRVEAGVISLDPCVADFHINWIQNIMDNAEIFDSYYC